jgi:hypothetical protein
MLASSPASILNHIRDEPGIPTDSKKISHALAGSRSQKVFMLDAFAAVAARAAAVLEDEY